MGEELIFERILLVEDDPSHALLIKRALRDVVGTIEHAATSAAACQALQERVPDLIITDLNLPDAASLSHVRALVERAPQAPMLVLTSSSSLRDAVEAMKLGARDFIVKNFDNEFREVLLLSLSRVHLTLILEQERYRLEREMHILRVAIESSDDGLALYNREGRLLYANRAFAAFAELCGGDKRELKQLLAEKVANVEKLQSGLVSRLSELPAGAVWSTEVGFVGNRSVAFSLSLSMVQTSVMQNLPGGRECVVWVRNISEQKRREAFQREILSTTTHDLKGPLGAIMISSDLLLNLLKGQERASELALRVGSSAQTAVNLIDEFLSARRIQEGTFILKPMSHDIAELADGVVDEYQTIAASRGVELKIGRPQGPVMCSIDKLGIGRVLGNLLSNALKFTQRGGNVTVSLSDGIQEVQIRVEDSGCGMEPAEVRGIFERFSRLEKHAHLSGTGLGLFVVKSIVAAHGGRIDVTSQVGKGTAFEITLPKAPPVNEHGELICLDFA